MTTSGNKSVPITLANTATLVSTLFGIRGWVVFFFFFFFLVLGVYVVKEDSVCFSKKDILGWVVLAFVPFP